MFGENGGPFMACDLTEEEFNKATNGTGLVTPDNKHLFYPPYGTRQYIEPTAPQELPLDTPLQGDGSATIVESL